LTPEETVARVKEMVTDPARIKRTDPGNPDICNVFTMHKIFSLQSDIDMVNVECRTAGIGCVDCKKLFAKNLNAHLEPFRAKRAELESQPGYVRDVLDDGAKRARVIAQKTMEEVREAMELP
ncbi:MAG: tryptophan--tRNA ligase, partial [Chloroflexota bacterium]|nr:tryptophan--tRNA ligase [Chloroflexota bacterium]